MSFYTAREVPDGPYHDGFELFNIESRSSIASELISELGTLITCETNIKYGANVTGAVVDFTKVDAGRTHRANMVSVDELRSRSDSPWASVMSL
jgi:hypothetical protein